MRAPLLVLALLCLAVTAAHARDDDRGYSPAALADKKEECTVNGRFDPVCLEFFTDVYVNYSKSVAREVQEELSRCFYIAKSTDKNGVSRSSADDATRIFEKKQDGDPAYQNKYVDACIEQTERVIPGWKKAASTDVERTAYYKRLKGKVSSDFTKTCRQGIDVHVGEEGEPFSIVGTHLVKTNTKVFLKETDPDGNQVSILCNGFVVGKTKAGKAFRVAPSTFAQIRAEADRQSSACLDHCLHTSAPDSECLATRQGVTTAGCITHCRNVCRR